MYKKLRLILVLWLISTLALANEGMWLPMFIKRLNYEDMQKHGLRLTAEEIYSVNNSSMKDAIVMLGGGFCTSEIISTRGLLLTNHHCAYDLIQKHSSVENDLLTNGFYAKTLADELPNPGLTASILVRMEDVTERILAGLNPSMTEQERKVKVGALVKEIVAENKAGNNYDVTVKDFFNGNEFYMFVYETYRDVRLVGNPAESIGKFGGDTDNWMWPRHTGDFSLLRIYTGPDGKPAEYAKDNVPLSPKHHLPVSLKGVKEGDYAMVMGFPGTTNRYLTSYGVDQALEFTYPLRIQLRETRLNTWREDMDKDAKVRLQYASKHASVANYWKYFIGQSQGLKRLKVVEKKRELEAQFAQWVAADANRTAQYGEALNLLKQGFSENAAFEKEFIYFIEGVMGMELVKQAYYHGELETALTGGKKEDVDKSVAALKESMQGFFKDYNALTDQKVVSQLMKLYFDGSNPTKRPEIFNTIEKKYKGNFNKYVAEMFAKSFFVSAEKYDKFIANPSLKVLLTDPAYVAAKSFKEHYLQNIMPNRNLAQEKIAKGNRLFVDGIRKMDPDKKYYPNANSTLRLTYGNVLDYSPKDGIIYNYFTTADGILQKEDPNNFEFVVPVNLKEKLVAQDYGQYADANGKLWTGFITNNDITGGNSGSPVINGDGQLIGLAFDGNWEAMSGDIAFEHDYQRCINVDIRYVLFLIDKVAGASHLVEEMTLIK